MAESMGKRYEDVQDVLRHHMMDRRGALRAGLGFGAAMVFGGGALSACSSGDGGGTYSGNTKKPAPAEGGGGAPIGKANIPTPRDKTVIIGQVDFQVFNSFNPMIPNGSQGGNGFDTMVREYMFYLNLPTGELIPWLATGYEYNADFTTLTFKFDPTAKWSDGKPLTSEDFKFSVLLRRDNPALLGGGGNAKDFIANIQTPDPQTAILELNKPNPRLHYDYICSIVASFDILPKHIWEKEDPTKFKDNPPLRTGPYMLDKAIPNQKMYVYKKNPNYWNKAKLDPAPEFVIFQSTATSQDAASQAFKRAEFDVGSLDEQHAKQLRSEGYEKLITTPFNDPCPRALWPNHDPARGIISDPRMHHVISYLTDREKIGKSVWPVETPPAQYPWANYDGNKKWEIPAVADKYKLEFSPQKAEALLDEMGATKNAQGKRMWKGKPATIEIITPAPVDGAEYIIGQTVVTELKKVGIAANVRSYTGSVHSEKWERGEFDISSQWCCSMSQDPGQLYNCFQTRYAKKVGENAVGRNQVRLKDPELDTLSKQLDNLDPQSPEAKPLLGKALDEYYQNLPVIPVIQTNYPAYYNTTFWEGWPTEDDLYNVPNNWWGQFMFVIGRLKPTGQK